MIYLRQFLYIFLTFAFSTVYGQVTNKMMYTTQNDAGYVDLVFDPISTTEIASTTIATNSEGITHVQNSIGDLLFYVKSDGIFNPAGGLMTGSPALFGDEEITEVNVSEIPGTGNQFYVFYTRDKGCSNLFYSKVDMSGTGIVYSANTMLADSTYMYAEGKEIIDIPLSSEKWLVVYNCNTGFDKYLINQTGVTGPITINSWVPAGPVDSNYYGKGELDYNAETIIYAASGSKIVHTFDFLPCEGEEVAGTGKNFSTLEAPYGAEVSPTGINLFVTFLDTVRISAELYNFASIKNTSGASVDYALIQGAQACGSSTAIGYSFLGQLELGSNSKMYSPAIGSCSIIEFDDLELATYSTSVHSVGERLNRGLSDIIQSEAFLSFLQLDVTVNHIECYGAENGEIQLSISGGIPPYNVTWFDGSNATTRVNLSTGSYSVTISDGSCAELNLFRSIYITEPDSISIEIETEDALCFSGAGELDYEIKGGTPPYELRWPADYDPAFPTAGDLQLLVVDAHGCTQVADFAIDQPDRIEWMDTVINSVCNDDLGQIIISNLKGGVPPYLINGSPDTIVSAKAGWIEVQIVDRNGCEKTFGRPILQPKPIEIEIELEQKDCSVFEASATAEATGGSGPLTLEWLAVDSTSIVPGKYAVRAIDSNGCDGYEVFTFTPEETKVYTPNAFTPNGDGHNEYFQPALYCYRSLSFSVYSRWGEQVFESTPDNLKWFGFNKEGKQMPSDVYVYKIEFIDAEGLSHAQEGTVLLTY